MASRNDRNQRPSARRNTSAAARPSRDGRKAPQQNKASRNVVPTHNPGDYSSYSRSSYGTRPEGWDGAQTPRPQSGAYRSAYTPDANYRGSSAAAQYSRNAAQYRASKKRGRGKKIAIGVVSALVVVLIGVGVALATYVNGINKELQGGKTSEELQAIDQELASTTTFTKPFYVMLIGSDAREGDDEMGQRSDTNIVARVDPSTNTVTMVSIPRDTMTEIDGVGTAKFNAAYFYDGAAGVIREAKQLTGISVSHYAEINFEGLTALVDAVGGVDVVVDERIDDTDADNTTDFPENPRIIIEAGEQHLNGEQALVFARSRAYTDGDFTRVANQRKLIQAIVDKVMSMSPTDIPGVVSAAAKCVTTDLTVSDLVNLALQMRDDGEMTIYSATIPSATQMVGGVSYVIADKANTKELMKVVDSGGDPTSVSNGYLASY